MNTLDVPEVDGIKVGDTVTIGRGKTEWVVASFGRFTDDGMTFASLTPVVGYTNTTAPVTRLVRKAAA